MSNCTGKHCAAHSPLYVDVFAYLLIGAKDVEDEVKQRAGME